MKEVIEFLKEYIILCKKYHMGFGGCGCCGSSYLEYEDNKYIDRIVYNFNLNEIFVGGSGFQHERPDLYSPEEYTEETLDEYLKELEKDEKKENE